MTSMKVRGAKTKQTAEALLVGPAAVWTLAGLAGDPVDL